MGHQVEEYQWDSPSELEQDNSGVLKNVEDTHVVGLFYEKSLVYWGCSKKSLLSLQLVGCTGIWGTLVYLRSSSIIRWMKLDGVWFICFHENIVSYDDGELKYCKNLISKRKFLFATPFLYFLQNFHCKPCCDPRRK